RAVELTDWLLDQKYNVDCLHGDLSQAKRKTVMKAFRDAKLQLLVATDLAARGLDIEGVTHIINYDIPHDPDWYVHRVGRTGRAGNTGIAITLYTAEESKWLKKIEEKLSLTMEKQNLDGAIIKRRVNDKSVKRMKTVSKTTDKRKVKTTKPAQRRLGSSAKTKQRKGK
ncbi:MAG TPA: C-terminal helicase domain-containing protein, partial [Candidatus Avacidaminococcus intestinavium]|nr:C-terminal helicase domain-containing protein [Candidatus Avacidaminococcus intestinavium]